MKFSFRLIIKVVLEKKIIDVRYKEKKEEKKKAEILLVQTIRTIKSFVGKTNPITPSDIMIVRA
jgi:hypothetical protein